MNFDKLTPSIFRLLVRGLRRLNRVRTYDDWHRVYDDVWQDFKCFTFDNDFNNRYFDAYVRVARRSQARLNRLSWTTHEDGDFAEIASVSAGVQPLAPAAAAAPGRLPVSAVSGQAQGEQPGEQPGEGPEILHLPFSAFQPVPSSRSARTRGWSLAGGASPLCLPSAQASAVLGRSVSVGLFYPEV